MINDFITKRGKGLDIDIRNAEDQTPLMTAVNHGLQNTVEILLKNGVNTNSCIKIVSTKCIVGMTTLYMSAEKDDVPIVQFLLNTDSLDDRPRLKPKCVIS